MKKKGSPIYLVILFSILTLFLPGCISAGEKVVVIPLTGSITSGGASSFFSAVITPGLVREQLARASNDPSVKAIVLRIESPGGLVAPCQEIQYEIEKAKERKPVVVSMGSQATSGGYYISAKANKIVALPTTMTGSIGVISQIPIFEGLYEKLGVDWQIFKGGKYKDMYAGIRELLPEEKIIMQQMVDEYYEQFIDVVAEGRGLSRDEVRELATGQIYTGADAKRLGLVDELGGLSTAIDLAAQLAGIQSPQVETYSQSSRSPLSFLLGAGVENAQMLAEMKALGLNEEDLILLEALKQAYPVPQYFY